MGTRIVKAVGVLHLELLSCQVLMFLLQIDEDSAICILDVISFAYLSHFSNFNISGTNADICKR